MKKYRVFPTVLGLILVIVGIAAGAIAVRQGSNWLLRAEPEATPKQVKVTNITDKGFTVSWITDVATSGFVKYGLDESPSFIVSDSRDQVEQVTESYPTHYFTLENLEPSTDYYFKIGSEGKLFDNNGQPFQVTTAPASQGPPPPNDVAYGIITKTDGSPAAGAIVYLSLAEITPLSALVNSSGNWIIPLNLARSNDLSSFATYDNQVSVLEIFVQGGALGTATAMATTSHDSPLPDIVLGNNYDFREALAGKPVETTTAQDSKFPLDELSATPAQTEPLEIINPTEGETVFAQKPNILGKGPAGETLEVKIESSTTQSGTVLINEKGEWEWSPPENLEAGEHQVTISYYDNDGAIHSLSRAFSVYAADAADSPSLPAFESSPSATLTPPVFPTSQPVLTPTAIPTTPTTLTPTATPTTALTPTVTPGPSITPTTTVFPTTVPSTDSSRIEEPGNLTPALLALLIAGALIGLGIFYQQPFSTDKTKHG